MALPWQLPQQYQNASAQNYYGGGISAPQSNGGNDIAGLLKLFAGANYNLSGTNTKPQQNIAGEIGNLANASYNMDNPLYQQIYGQERGAAQQDLAGSIAELMRQNRKETSMGRKGILDQERGGEGVFRALTQGYQSAQDTARQRARQIIGAGQSAQSGAYNTYGNLSQQQDTNKKKQAFGLGNLADALPLLAKFL